MLIDTYDDLWRWSTNQVPQFWYEIFHYLQIKGQNPPKSPEDVVDERLPMFPRPTWFKNTSINFAENLLFPTPEIEDPDHVTAIIEASEAGVQQRVTWTELRNRVAQFAAALKAAGVAEGDRVGGMNLEWCSLMIGVLANTSHAVVAFLATASIGALWSCTSPDFGASSILDRLSQVEPKILLADNAVLYNGRGHDSLAKIALVVAGIKSLQKVVIFPNVKSHSMDVSGIPNGCVHPLSLLTSASHLTTFCLSQNRL
jgi:acetoacetyl-CoA synthetase